MAWLMWWAMVEFSGSERFSISKILLGLGDAAGGERRGLGLFVHDVVGVNVDVLFLLFVRLRDDLLAEAGDESLGAAVHLRGLLVRCRR